MSTYSVTCLNKNGNIKWKERFDNLVTDEGARFLLDTTFGGSYNSTYFLGLVEAAAVPNPADTMSSHKEWKEASIPRAAVTWAKASNRSKSTSPVVSFIASEPTTIGGCFLVTGAEASSMTGSATGVLYSVGSFKESRSLSAGDTIQVTYSAAA